MHRFSLPAVLAALLLAAGCVDFDYVGREFPPTPESEPVVYFINREQIPPGEYRIMGRAVITAPDGTDGYDIQDLLMKKARAYGADAVCLVRTRKVDVGLFSRNDNTPAGPQQPLDPANVDFKGAPSTAEAEREEYGEPVVLAGEKRARQEVVVEALYLKNKAELEKLAAEQDRELNEILGEKAEPARPGKQSVTVPETGDEEAVTGREPEEKDSPAEHEAETPAAHEAEPAPAAAQE